jgi:hypothetical protein
MNRLYAQLDRAQLEGFVDLDTTQQHASPSYG